VIKKEAQILKGIDFKTAPRLLGYVATKPKERAQVLLESERKDPVLARWQYGLGKTAAFTSDLKDRWAVDWLRWNGYSKFWSQLVRQTMRAHDDSQLDLRVLRDGDHARITIDAIEKDGEFRNEIDARLRVLAPDQSVTEVPIAQVGPGSYEADVALTQRGSYVFRLIGEAGGTARTLAYSYPDEYHFYPPNTDALRALSNETKGKFQPDPADIFDTRGESAPSPIQLWPYLVVLALLLYLGDVLLRRVRLFEQA
jgi:Ca-activated chloride channel homolog